MADLKPCPFCGRDAKVYGDGDVGFFVGCLGPALPGNTCFATMGENYDRDAMPEHVYRTEAEAIAAWNRRAAAHDGDVEALIARERDSIMRDIHSYYGDDGMGGMPSYSVEAALRSFVSALRTPQDDVEGR